MISFNKYKLILKGVCSNCRNQSLVFTEQQGYSCPICKHVFLLDKRRKCVVEPDCQKV